MLLEDSSAEWLDFTEGDGSHPGSFESEIESTDAGEKVEDIHVPAYLTAETLPIH